MKRLGPFRAQNGQTFQKRFIETCETFHPTGVDSHAHRMGPAGAPPVSLLNSVSSRHPSSPPSPPPPYNPSLLTLFFFPVPDVGRNRNLSNKSNVVRDARSVAPEKRVVVGRSVGVGSQALRSFLSRGKLPVDGDRGYGVTNTDDTTVTDDGRLRRVGYPYPGQLPSQEWHPTLRRSGRVSATVHLLRKGELA